MEENGSIDNLIKVMDITLYMVLAAAALFAFYSYKTGLFSSSEAFRQFIVGFGIWAPLIFLLIQIVQVIIPVLPGAVTYVASILIFGVRMGLIYNYIGVCIGSIAVFLFSKKYGQVFVKRMIGERRYRKYIGWVDKGSKFDKFFTLAIFFPIAPDDLLCYMAGLTEMRLKKFVAVILLGKPIPVALYSIGMTVIFEYLIRLIF